MPRSKPLQRRSSAAYPWCRVAGASDKTFSSGFRYTFGLLGPGQDYFKDLLEGASTLKPRPSRVAIVAADQSIHVEIAEGARREAEQLGFEVVGFYPFGKKEDLAALARKLKTRNPDLILFSSYFQDAAPFVQAAKATGLDA
ncbi:MAG TPA: hypothetical protein ENO16_05935, partial [Chromatiales bacterium]|nr:hypothetical protein [Chromatiales bacterium]